MLNYSIDADGIALVELDYPAKSQNILNATSMGAYAETMTKALADPAVKGMVVASAKKDFIAGGDLAELGAAADATSFHRDISNWHKLMRAIELGGKPVAAALNGSALGGGLEVALGCHYRVAADNPKARFGFPEVTLGLLPGAGGTQRTPRLTGMQAAAPLLMEGKRIKAAEAQKLGLIHAVVPVGDERKAAREWVMAALASGRNRCSPGTAKATRFPAAAPTRRVACRC